MDIAQNKNASMHAYYSMYNERNTPGVAKQIFYSFLQVSDWIWSPDPVWLWTRSGWNDESGSAKDAANLPQ
jgi:hypothetical protein